MKQARPRKLALKYLVIQRAPKLTSIHPSSQLPIVRLTFSTYTHIRTSQPTCLASLASRCSRRLGGYRSDHRGPNSVCHSPIGTSQEGCWSTVLIPGGNPCRFSLQNKLDVMHSEFPFDTLRMPRQTNSSNVSDRRNNREKRVHNGDNDRIANATSDSTSTALIVGDNFRGFAKHASHDNACNYGILFNFVFTAACCLVFTHGIHAGSKLGPPFVQTVMTRLRC